MWRVLWRVWWLGCVAVGLEVCRLGHHLVRLSPSKLRESDTTAVFVRRVTRPMVLTVKTTFYAHHKTVDFDSTLPIYDSSGKVWTEIHHSDMVLDCKSQNRLKYYQKMCEGNVEFIIKFPTHAELGNDCTDETLLERKEQMNTKKLHILLAVFSTKKLHILLAVFSPLCLLLACVFYHYACKSNPKLVSQSNGERNASHDNHNAQGIPLARFNTNHVNPPTPPTTQHQPTTTRNTARNSASNNTRNHTSYTARSNARDITRNTTRNNTNNNPRNNTSNPTRNNSRNTTPTRNNESNNTINTTRPTTATRTTRTTTATDEGVREADLPPLYEEVTMEDPPPPYTSIDDKIAYIK